MSLNNPPTTGLPTITIIGSLNADLVTYTPRLPKAGETLTASSFRVGTGGKGANQAVACAKLSRRRLPQLANHSTADNSSATATIKMVGAVGGLDTYGSMLTSSLTAAGVDTSGVSVVSDKGTGVAVIIVEEEGGQNRIMLQPGANGTVGAGVDAALGGPGEGTEKPDLLIMQLEIPLETVVHLLKRAREVGVPVLLNPAPADAELPRESLAGLAHLIVNETEAALLSGVEESKLASQEGREEVAAIFHAEGKGVENVVITLGADGVFYSSLEGQSLRSGHIVAQKCHVVDTTAAGDTFVGAYALEVVKRRAEGEAFDIKLAARTASQAAAKTVMRKGAQESIPWLDEMLGTKGVKRTGADGVTFLTWVQEDEE